MNKIKFIWIIIFFAVSLSSANLIKALGDPDEYTISISTENVQIESRLVIDTNAIITAFIGASKQSSKVVTKDEAYYVLSMDKLSISSQQSTSTSPILFGAKPYSNQSMTKVTDTYYSMTYRFSINDAETGDVIVEAFEFTLDVKNNLFSKLQNSFNKTSVKAFEKVMDVLYLSYHSEAKLKKNIYENYGLDIDTLKFNDIKNKGFKVIKGTGLNIDDDALTELKEKIEQRKIASKPGVYGVLLKVHEISFSEERLRNSFFKVKLPGVNGVRGVTIRMKYNIQEVKFVLYFIDEETGKYLALKLEHHGVVPIVDVKNQNERRKKLVSYTIETLIDKLIEANRTSYSLAEKKLNIRLSSRVWLAHGIESSLRTDYFIFKNMSTGLELNVLNARELDVESWSSIYSDRYMASSGAKFLWNVGLGFHAISPERTDKAFRLGLLASFGKLLELNYSAENSIYDEEFETEFVSEKIYGMKIDLVTGFQFGKTKTAGIFINGTYVRPLFVDYWVMQVPITFGGGLNFEF